MGLSFGSLAGKILISSDQKKKKKRTAFQWIRIQSTFARSTHSDFRNLGLFTIWSKWWQKSPLRRAFSESLKWFWFPCLIFFSSLPDLISCCVLCFTLVKTVLRLPSPYWLACIHIYTSSHTHKDAHAQISHTGPGGKVKGHLHNGFSCDY